MFPYNYTLAGKEGPEYDYDAVLEKAREEGIGTLCIKGFAKGPWPEDVPEDERPYDTWYEPYDDPTDLEECLRFSLSNGMTTIPNAGDPQLVPAILEAAQHYEALDADAQDELRREGASGESPVPTTYIE